LYGKLHRPAGRNVERDRNFLVIARFPEASLTQMFVHFLGFSGMEKWLNDQVWRQLDSDEPFWGCLLFF